MDDLSTKQTSCATSPARQAKVQLGLQWNSLKANSQMNRPLMKPLQHLYRRTHCRQHVHFSFCRETAAYDSWTPKERCCDTRSNKQPHRSTVQNVSAPSTILGLACRGQCTTKTLVTQKTRLIACHSPVHRCRMRPGSTERP